MRAGRAKASAGVIADGLPNDCAPCEQSRLSNLHPYFRPKDIPRDRRSQHFFDAAQGPYVCALRFDEVRCARATLIPTAPTMKPARASTCPCRSLNAREDSSGIDIAGPETAHDDASGARNTRSHVGSCLASRAAMLEPGFANPRQRSKFTGMEPNEIMPVFDLGTRPVPTLTPHRGERRVSYALCSGPRRWPSRA